MSLQRQSVVIYASLIITLMTIFLTPATGAFYPPAGAQPTATPDEMPRAQIKNIVVNGQERTEANTVDVEVVRAKTGTTEPATAGMRLYAKDRVTTGVNAQVTILFLDSPTEKSNQVIVGSDSRAEISSIYSWWGKFFASIKDYFDVKSKTVNLSVKGTEFEFKLAKDGGEAKLTVLDGKVGVKRAETSSSRPVEGAPPKPRTNERGRLFSSPLLSSFAPLSPQENQLSFEVVSGSTTTAKLRASLKNICRQQHRYEISMPGHMPWLTLVAGGIVEIKNGELKTFEIEVRVDATNLPVAVYQGGANATCLDCSQEPDCPRGYYLPIELKVKAAGPGQVAGEVTVQELEELTLKIGEPLSKKAATETEVRSVLTWTNEVILTSQPTYAAENIIPHFASREQRSQAFTDARFRAIWRGEPGSYETLGDIYSDWGEGAKAVQSYEKELVVNNSRQDSPDFLTGLGEAYRLTGRLEQAEEKLRRALAVSQQWTPALNALGNVHLDRASVARDKKDNLQARASLESAKTYYLRSVQSPSRRRDIAWNKIVSQTNLGEVDTALGDLAQDEGRLEEARSQYEVAERELKSAEASNPAYPFASTGLGQVYRKLGNVAQSQGDQTRARQAYGQSETQFNRALSAHSDLAEAHLGLGNLYQDTNREDAAIQSYTRATQVRPEEPSPYYNLSVLLQQRNPRLAAEYAQTYLQLERPAFTQGEKGTRAKVIAGEASTDQVPVPSLISLQSQAAQESILRAQLKVGSIIERPSQERAGTVIEQNPKAGTSLARGRSVNLVIAGTTGPPVKVPGLKGDSQDKAVKELTKNGLKAEVKEQPDCEKPGKVLRQEPEKGTQVPSGSTVTIFVASPGENAPRVPRLEGLQREDAVRELSELRLKFKIGLEENDRVSTGTVLKQKPDAFTQLKADCTVELTVAIPIPLVEVPDFRGMTIEEAQRRLPNPILGALGGAPLVRGGITYRESFDVASGTVIDQNPAPQSRVRRGMQVDLVVARGQRNPRSRGELLRVPDVKGKSTQEAISILKDAGFVPEIVEQGEYVYEQSPAGEAMAARGSTVKLWFKSSGLR